MINVKQAVETAVAYVKSFHELMPEQSIRLEETELTTDDDGRDIWRIVLGLADDDPFGRTASRKYKVFEIDANQGDVRRMKSMAPFGN